jgi:hypothetical protein
LPASAEKNRIAMTLFKDKTGEVIPVIEQMGGSFADFQKEQERLGKVMTDEQSRIADVFGDTFTEIGQVALGAGRQFAFEFIPEMTRAMRDLEDLLVRNKDRFKDWGTYVGNVIGGVRIAARALAEYNAGPGGVGQLHRRFRERSRASVRGERQGKSDC